MSAKSITREKLRELCIQGGCYISQSTVSNAKNGKCNLTLSNLIAIAYALECDVTDLLSMPPDLCEEETQKDKVESVNDTQVFLSNPNSIFFQGYLDIFYVLFYKTSGSGEEMVRGTLCFQKSGDNKTCEAILNLPLEDFKDGSKSRDEKVRGGTCSVAYDTCCILLSAEYNCR